MTRNPPTCRGTATFAVALLIFPIAAAADWTRWLGPEQNGASPEKSIFGQATPELDLVWSRPLGIAYSGIAVASDRAVTMFGDGETDWLTAIDASSGEEVWRYRIDSMFPKVGGAHGGPLSTPVIEDGVVYALGAKGQLFAVKLGDGSELWSVRIDKTLGAKQPQFGFTTTPLVVADVLFVITTVRREDADKHQNAGRAFLNLDTGGTHRVGKLGQGEVYTILHLHFGCVRVGVDGEVDG